MIILIESGGKVRELMIGQSTDALTAALNYLQPEMQGGHLIDPAMMVIYDVYSTGRLNIAAMKLIKNEQEIRGDAAVVAIDYDETITGFGKNPIPDLLPTSMVE